MTSMLKNPRLAVAAAAALLVASSLATAWAQAPASPAAATPPASAAAPAASHRMGPGGPRDAARWQQRFDRHMAELRQTLQLTPAQEGTWNQFVAAMRPPAVPPMAQEREAMASLTTPQRLDRMQAMRRQHLAEMDKRDDATRAFYATLNDEQKKIFDANTGRPAGRRGPR